MPSYNLVEEPWIPCVMVADGSVREFGLSDVLLRSPEVRELSHSSPLVVAALHRILLSILHRNYGPKDTAQWGRLWSRGAWDEGPLVEYFQRWYSRFDLFDDCHPFYQAKGLSFQYEGSVSRLVHEFSSGNNATLFDHSVDGLPSALSAAEAACYLVAHQALAIGGLVSFEKGQDRGVCGSADNAPLTKAAVAVVRGNNLFETLMLNLHQYNGEDEEPFSFDETLDMPAWERDEETQAGDRYPTGYIDLLTWQSRRVRLRAELEASGRLVVPSVVIMKGYQFPDGWSIRGRETMAAFCRSPNARKAGDPWPAVSFQENRGLWRDSVALFQSLGDERERPKTLDWLSDLEHQRILSRAQTLPVDFFGLCTDRAKVLLWRHERLPLPLAYLDDTDLLSTLKDGLDLAESVGRLFSSGFVDITTEEGPRKVPSPFRKLAAVALSPMDDTKADPGAVGRLLVHLAPGRLYWSRLETPFKRFMVELAEERAGNRPENAFREWVVALRDSAVGAFKEATLGLDGSGRTLRAVALAEREFNRRLRELLEERL